MHGQPRSTATTLAALAQRLLLALRGERQFHDQLLRLTAEERAAIANPAALTTPDGPLPLERIVVEKERVVARLAELEAARITISGTLAVALHLPRETRLVDLFPHLPAPLVRLLQAERTALLDKAQELTEANTANAALLHEALATTRLTLDYMRSVEGSAYDSDGRPSMPSTRPVRLDCQA
jgi:flagellar biosynthesis/type III secretory pathway chaperone